jgi:hypothetical protein
MGNNLLRKKEDHYKLIELINVSSKEGESLINSDLIFEYEVEPQSLNERTTTKRIVIPREQIINSQKNA